MRILSYLSNNSVYICINFSFYLHMFDSCTIYLKYSMISQIAMINQHTIIFGAIATCILLLLASLTSTQFAFAHQRQLFTIGDKDYLFVVGSINEPVFV